jgi:hypothetical protein
MSNNFPEKNIVDKLIRLGEAFRGIMPEDDGFPSNYPGKLIADKIDELIAIIQETGGLQNKTTETRESEYRKTQIINDPGGAGVGVKVQSKVTGGHGAWETSEDNSGSDFTEGDAGEAPSGRVIGGHYKANNGTETRLALTKGELQVQRPGEIFKPLARREEVDAETTARQAYDAEQDQKLETLNGHYYPLDGYDFGKTLDVKTPNPDDVTLLTTYAMTMEGVAELTQIIENTVIKNEYDGVEFVWNAVNRTWLDWGIGNIVTASNDHLGVVEGTADLGDGSRDGVVKVLPGGRMETIGFSKLKAAVGNINTALNLINGEPV